MKKYSGVIGTILVLAILAGVNIARNNTTEGITNKNFTKQQYIDIAVDNCKSDENPENYCRCVYTGLLENHTVEEVFAFDKAVSENPKDYAYTDEQIQLVKDCN